MTIDGINKRIDDLRVACGAGPGGWKARKGDEGDWHRIEDKLKDDVLLAIANGECDDPKGCAAAVLVVNTLDYSRWYA